MVSNSTFIRAILLSVTFAILAGAAIMAVAGLVVGFDFTVWPEREGRIAGAAATIASILGAGFGLWLALRR